MTAPDLVALDDQILAVLRDEWLPVSTAEIAKRVGRQPADPVVYRRLHRLERREKVKKIRLRDHRAAYWTLKRVQNVPTGGRL